MSCACRSGEYLVDGGMSVSELNDLLDTRIPDDDWDTIGGFVFNTLGHVPERGDSIEHDGWQFIADEVEGRRIRRLRGLLTAFDARRRRRVAERTRRRLGQVASAPMQVVVGGQGRARHGRVEGDRAGDRGRHGRGRRLGDAQLAQARAAGGRRRPASPARPPCSLPTPARSTPPRPAWRRRSSASAGSTSWSTTPPPTRTTAPRSTSSRRCSTRRSRSTCAARCTGRGRRTGRRSRTQPGVIVNIASVGGLRAEFGLGVYNLTKAALIHLTRQLANELGPTPCRRHRARAREDRLRPGAGRQLR